MTSESSKRSSTRNSGATTSTMDGRRTTAVFGGSIVASGGAGKSGLTGGRGERHSLGRAMSSSFNAIRSSALGSHAPGPAKRVIPDEPAAVIPHGGLGEGGGPARPHGNPTRARSWKRWIRTREPYR